MQNLLQHLPLGLCLILSLNFITHTSATAPPRVPTTQEIGPTQILIDNDLTPGTRPGAAIALLTKINQQEAKTRCEKMNEKLLSLSDLEMGSENLTALNSQIDYLIYGKIIKSSHLWIDNENGLNNGTGTENGSCSALDITTKKPISIPCDSNLNALCSSSGPFTIDITENEAALNPGLYIQINSSEWQLTGYRDGRAYKFLGIPFGDPPVGQARFALPSAFSGEKSRMATQYGNVCPQAPSGVGSPNGLNESEDCLNLNVYTPYLPAAGESDGEDLKPVGVYFYGGE